MDLKECYDALGGNYAEVLERMRMERLIKKFALKFLDDPSFSQLQAALDSRNGDEAFRAAHTLKGVCQNLSFTRLYESSHELTETLRHGWTDAALPIAEKVAEDYRVTTEAIRRYQADVGA